MTAALISRARAVLCAALVCTPLLAAGADFTGLVEPLHDISLSSGIGGIVARRLVQPGSRVSRGQVLMVLDDRLQVVEAERRRVLLQDTSELRATEERVRISRSLYQDARRVFEQTGSISRDELMRLEADYLSTQGRMEQLRAQKEREQLEHHGAVQERQMRQLAAPVGGTVTKVDIQVGEWAKPGEPLVRLVDASTLVFRANLPLPAVTGLRVGVPVAVLVESGASALQVPARVTFVSPVADPASGLVEVRASVPNATGRLRAGSRAVLRLGGAPAVVPAAGRQP